MTVIEYDVIVLGAGPTGENVAARTVQGGLSTALVEHDLVGGDCSYFACIPSKALLRSEHVLRAARSVGGAREAVRGTVDVDAVLARRDALVSGLSDEGQTQWVESAGIVLHRGHGRITAPREVTVRTADGTSTILRARHGVVIATGSDAYIPNVPGLWAAQPWTSRDATSAHEVPKSLVILGGGVVGVEMATAYASFGTAVTIISRGGILDGLEPFAGRLVLDSLRARGVTVLVHAETTRVTRRRDGVTVDVAGGDHFDAEQVLVATGRMPRTRTIGLELIGLTPGDWLATDETMRVHGFDWLYAVGDVNHRALLTHQGKYQARAVGDVLAARADGSDIFDSDWGAHVATADRLAVPQVIFTSPEVASVGRTSAAARSEGFDIRVVDYEIGNLAGAGVHADGYAGMARMIVDERRSVVIGATLVGPDVGELLHAATIAIVGEIPISRLWHATPAFPTLSEIWLRLLEAYGRRSAIAPYIECESGD